MSRRNFQRRAKELGYDDKIYGLHSLRSGDITSVVNNNVTKSAFLKDFSSSMVVGKLTWLKNICMSPKTVDLLYHVV